MGNREIKQQARRAALDAQSKRREERAERERRLERLAIRVLVAIRERQAAVRDADRRAGEALVEMIETEGLSAREAVQWCGDEVSTREVTRLRRVAADSTASAATLADADTDADGSQTAEALGSDERSAAGLGVSRR